MSNAKELARDVRERADELNAAVRAAKSAGLQVEIDTSLAYQEMGQEPTEIVNVRVLQEI